MSLKVHDGFQFKAVDYKALSQSMAEVFETFEGMARSHVEKFIVARATQLHDGDWWARREDKTAMPPRAFSSYLQEAQNEWWTRLGLIRSTNGRDAEVDGDIEIACWPGPDGHFYGRVISEVSGVRDLLLEKGLARDFAYWNNTDPPQGMTPVEWDYRFYVWDEVYKGMWGRVCSFKTSALFRYQPHPASVLGHLPTLRHRAKAIVRTALLWQWLRELGLPAGAQGTAAQNLDFFRELSREGSPLSKQYRDWAERLELELPALA